VAFAVEHDLWLFADEVYADIVYEGRYVPTATLPQAAPRTITVHSLSKSHALAGYRIGYVVAPAEVVAQARRVSTHTGFNVPVVLQKAAVAALNHGDAWALSARETYRAARKASADCLLAHGLPFVSGEGGTYHFVDCASLLGGGNLTALLTRALDAGVLLAPGDAFGASYDQWARICFSSAPIADVLDGIARFTALR
jgi:aspartate/methionine/tyrosine aminotransferase